MTVFTHRLLALSILVSLTSPADASELYVSTELTKGKMSHIEQGISQGTQLESGSIAKYICSLALLKAVEQNRVKLDQPITTVLPYLLPDPFHQVSVRDVLANRSGLKNNFEQVLKSDPDYPSKVTSTQTALLDLLNPRLKFEPGAQFDYELINWLIAQAMIEQVYKLPIADVLKKVVFIPAKTIKTDTFVGNIESDNSAVQSVKSRPIPAFLTCAGGIKTTPSDLLRIAMHHFSMFEPEMLATSTELTTEDQNYALGGRFKQVLHGEKQIMISHQSGQNGDFRASVVYIPLLKTGFAIMTPDIKVDINILVSQWLSSKLD